MAFGDFEIGRIYNRRVDIHGRYGGQQYGGGATPAGHPVIFLFTGQEGKQHGYSDEQMPDGTYRYFGEGQRGDMVMTKCNKAIRDHAADGKDILLFASVGKGQVRFMGEYGCGGFDYQPAPDSDGVLRQAIVFHLVPQHAAAQPLLQTDRAAVTLSLAEKRRRAFAAAKAAPGNKVSVAKRNYYERSEDVRDYVLSRAQGRCEGCAQPAPFQAAWGGYLEPHHIRRLSDGGPDDPRHMAALCPNCHKAAHHSVARAELNRRLAEVITRLEAGKD